MGQPNLSKSIKELEAELGQTLFFPHGARGAAHPRRGGLSRLCAQHSLPKWKACPSFTAGTARPPRACNGRAAPAIFQTRSAPLPRSFPPPAPRWAFDYRETNSMDILHAVASGEAELGILRCQDKHAGYFETLCEENGLHAEVLWQYSMVLLMSEHHPLAALGEIPYHLLRNIPRNRARGPPPCCRPSSRRPAARCTVPTALRWYERGSQFDLLRRVQGSYMWVSPMPFEVLAREELVQKPCRTENCYRDIAIRKTPLGQPGLDFCALCRTILQAWCRRCLW